MNADVNGVIREIQPISGNFIPIDRNTIMLNPDGQLFANITADGMTIFDDSGTLHTAIGGYTEELPPVDNYIVQDATNNGYYSNNSPLWDFSGGMEEFKAEMGIATQGSYVLGNLTVYKNGTLLQELQGVQIRNNGTSGVTFGPTTGANRASLKTESGQVDNFRIKFYVTSSPEVFETTDVLTLSISIPGQPGIAYHSIDGHFIGIDGTTMGYDEVNNQIYALPQLPDAPTSDGDYVLKCHVVDGAVTYEWVLEA